MSKLLLEVPYYQREQVRELGAQWDYRLRCWYVDREQNTEPFAQWIPQHNGSTLAYGETYLLSTSTDCWRCDSSMKVVTIFAKNPVTPYFPVKPMAVSRGGSSLKFLVFQFPYSYLRFHPEYLQVFPVSLSLIGLNMAHLQSRKAAPPPHRASGIC